MFKTNTKMHGIFFVLCVIGLVQSRPSQSITFSNQTDYADYDEYNGVYDNNYNSNDTLIDHYDHNNNEISQFRPEQKLLAKNASKIESSSAEDYTPVLKALHLPPDFIDGSGQLDNSPLPDSNSQFRESEFQVPFSFPGPSEQQQQQQQKQQTQQQPPNQPQTYMTGNLQLDTVLNCPCQRFQLDALGVQGYPYQSKYRPPTTSPWVTEPPIHWESFHEPPPSHEPEHGQQESIGESIVTFIQVLRFLRQVPGNLKTGFMGILRLLVCPTKQDRPVTPKWPSSFGRNRGNLLSLGSEKVVNRQKASRTKVDNKGPTASDYDKRFDKWVAIMTKYVSTQVHLASKATAATQKANFTTMTTSKPQLTLDLVSEASDPGTSVSAPSSENFSVSGGSSKLKIDGTSSFVVPDGNQTNGKVLLIVPLVLNSGDVESRIRETLMQNNFQYQQKKSNILMRV